MISTFAKLPTHRFPQRQLLVRGRQRFSVGKTIQVETKLTLRSTSVAMSWITNRSEAEVNLLLTCACMFVGAMAAGSLPFLLRLRHSADSMITAAGAGVLVSTALCVVLPEGFHSYLDAVEHNGSDEVALWPTGAALIAGFLTMMLVQAALERYTEHDHDRLDAIQGGATPAPSQHPGSPGCGPVRPLNKPLLARHDAVMTVQSNQDDVQVITDKGGDAVSLLQRRAVAQLLPGPSPAASPDVLDEALLDAGRHQHHCRRGSCDLDAEGEALDAPSINARMTAFSMSEAGISDFGVHNSGRQALAGLVMHAAADGLAVGTASLAASLTISVAVAVAMTLHKGPVSFGLTAFLRGCGWRAGKVLQGLLVFAATSPLTALLTYYLLDNVPGMTHPVNVALLILFSGGTFVYAACMHILPSVLGPHNSRLSFRRLAAIVVGAGMPLLVSAFMPED